MLHTSLAIGKCNKCGRLVHEDRKHVCVRGINGLGTQQMSQLRGSSIGAQIDGNVELAYRRGYSKGYEDGKSGKKPRA